MTKQYHRTVFGWLGLGAQLWLGCAAPLADTPEHQPAVSADVPVDVVKPGGDDGLALLTNTRELLIGTYTHPTGQLSFELSHLGAERVATVFRADATIMVRMTFDAERETLQLGDHATLEGGPGSLSTGPEPDWRQTTLSADSSHLAQVSSSAELHLLRALGEALAARKDIDPSLLPANASGQTPSTTLAEPESSEGVKVAKTTQALSPFAPNCVWCMAGCTAASAACGQAAGWVASFVCAPASTLCYAGCIAGACQ
jgi:hypothetical protein